jgi:hypothetical protein
MIFLVVRIQEKRLSIANARVLHYKMQKYKNEKSFWLLFFTVGLQVRLFEVLENYSYHKPELNLKLEGATWIC